MSRETIVKCDLTLDKEQFDKYTDFLVWLKEDREKKNSGKENNDVKEIKHIKDFNERGAARFLIYEHTIGDLRDEADLRNSQYHAEVTISFIKDVLENISGTLDEKIKFFNTIKEEIPKFYGSEKDDENEIDK